MIAIFIAFAYNVRADDTDFRDKLQIGAKIGVNYSNVYDSQADDFNADAKLGLALGGFVAIPIGKYIVDFMCRQKKLIIEIDGIQHSSIKGLERDRQRDEYLSSEEYHVLRFNNSEISTNIDGVVDVIYGALQNPLLSPYKGDR